MKSQRKASPSPRFPPASILLLSRRQGSETLREQLEAPTPPLPTTTALVSSISSLPYLPSADTDLVLGGGSLALAHLCVLGWVGFNVTVLVGVSTVTVCETLRT